MSTELQEPPKRAMRAPRHGQDADSPEDERARNVGGNALRAAVLGMNDGLVSNLSLVMGVAGAELPNQAILITGLAGLMAGASAMALGEWLSVQSSRELHTWQIELERRALARNPAGEAEKLARFYREKGVPEPQARQIAAHLMEDEQSALDTLVREEFGVDPEELGGSAWEASGLSFLMFASGALIPLAPFVFLTGWAAIITSLTLTAAALFIAGFMITKVTGRHPVKNGMRSVVFGLTAAALTFAIGRMLGVRLGG